MFGLITANPIAITNTTGFPMQLKWGSDESNQEVEKKLLPFAFLFLLILTSIKQYKA